MGDQSGAEIDTVKIRILPDRRITAADAGKVFNRAQKTMAEWRLKGWGPRAIRCGGRIFHDYDECIAMARGEIPVNPLERIES